MPNANHPALTGRGTTHGGETMTRKEITTAAVKAEKLPTPKAWKEYMTEIKILTWPPEDVALFNAWSSGMQGAKLLRAMQAEG